MVEDSPVFIKIRVMEIKTGKKKDTKARTIEKLHLTIQETNNQIFLLFFILKKCLILLIYFKIDPVLSELNTPSLSKI